MSTQTVLQPDTPIIFGQNGWPLQGQWKYEDYLHLPDDGRRYEIIEGVLYMANAPNYDHQFTVGKVFYRLQQATEEKGLGVVLTAPFEVHLAESTRPVQPDVLFIKQDRLPAPGTQIYEGAPDLIVEVISPSSIRLDRTVKFDAYERYGVMEYWLVDPKARLIEVYTWARGEYALFGQYTGDDIVMSKLLDGLQIKASLLFQPSA